MSISPAGGGGFIAKLFGRKKEDNLAQRSLGAFTLEQLAKPNSSPTVALKQKGDYFDLFIPKGARTSTEMLGTLFPTPNAPPVPQGQEGQWMRVTCACEPSNVGYKGKVSLIWGNSDASTRVFVLPPGWVDPTSRISSPADVFQKTPDTGGR